MGVLGCSRRAASKWRDKRLSRLRPQGSVGRLRERGHAESGRGLARSAARRGHERLSPFDGRRRTTPRRGTFERQIPTAAYGLDFDARSVPGVDELGDSRPDHVGSNRCPLGLSDPPLASFFPLPLRASSPSPRQAVNRPRLDSAITRAVFQVITTSRAPSCPSRQDTVVCPCSGARCVPLRSSPQRSRRTRPCLTAPRCSGRRFAPAKIC
jgi:hypothetical protein